MALGNITKIRSKTGGRSEKPVYKDVMSFAGDSSYPTGGTANFKAFVRTQLGLAVDEIVDVHSISAGNNRVEYDYTNDKLLVRVPSTGAEVANATNLSATTFVVAVSWR